MTLSRLKCMNNKCLLPIEPIEPPLKKWLVCYSLVQKNNTIFSISKMLKELKTGQKVYPCLSFTIK